VWKRNGFPSSIRKARRRGRFRPRTVTLRNILKHQKSTDPVELQVFIRDFEHGLVEHTDVIERAARGFLRRTHRRQLLIGRFIERLIVTVVIRAYSVPHSPES
jgi:hypothetical protein